MRVRSPPEMWGLSLSMARRSVRAQMAQSRRTNGSLTASVSILAWR